MGLSLGEWRSDDEAERSRSAETMKLENASNPESPLIPFHGSSPLLKSLRVLPPKTRKPSTWFSPVRSQGYQQVNGALGFDGPLSAVQSLTRPRLPGLLTIPCPGDATTTRRLLDLPSGHHLCKLVLSRSHDADLQWIIVLVVGCSDALGRLDVRCHLGGTLTLFPDLTCN